MAKKDRFDGDDIETAEQPEKETAMAKKADEPDAPSLDGLVKMVRDGRTIHAHPTVVKEHMKNGWKPV